MATSSTFTLSASKAPERIAKHIARAGICSRRAAEALIAEGRVSVNGEVIDSPALNVTAADVITVDGTALPAREPAMLWRYHKPRGLVVTARDEKDRQTIFDTLPASLPRVLSVGRLDMDSEGLLLLTNDGGLARHLELPSTGWSRKYRVRVQGQVDPDALASLANGITIDGIRYGDIHARLDRQMPSNAWLQIAIREGKNREVRRIMEHLGHQVSRLIRVSYGPFMLGDLQPGAVEQIRPRVLADQLGLKPAEGSKDDSGFAKSSRPPSRGTRPSKLTTRGGGKPISGKGSGRDSRGDSRGDSRRISGRDAGRNLGRNSGRDSGRDFGGDRQNADHRRPASRHKTDRTRRR